MTIFQGSYGFNPVPQNPPYEVAGFCSICGKAVLYHVDGMSRSLMGTIYGMHIDGKGNVIDPGVYRHTDCHAKTEPTA